MLMVKTPSFADKCVPSTLMLIKVDKKMNTIFRATAENCQFFSFVQLHATLKSALVTLLRQTETKHKNKTKNITKRKSFDFSCVNLHVFFK